LELTTKILKRIDPNSDKNVAQGLYFLIHIPCVRKKSNPLDIVQ